MVNVNTPAWRLLVEHHKEQLNVHLRDLFVADPERFSRLSFELEGMLVDFSKQRVDQRTIELLLDLTKAADLEGWRARLFAGDKINVSEDRAVLHTALRYMKPGVFPSATCNVMPEVRAVRAQMREFSEKVRGARVPQLPWKKCDFSRGGLNEIKGLEGFLLSAL